ncbi:MAG: tyrosine-type recombinase/integrase [Acidobacteria bacterium]|nr:tyrosine-type recombinase/integrase [Acidobacteriota bacterium]
MSRTPKPVKSTSLSPPLRTLAEWASLYLQEFATGSPATLKIKISDLQRFITWFETHSQDPQAWTPAKSQDFLNGLTLKPRTKNRIRAHLMLFAKWLTQHLPFPWDPLDGVSGTPVPTSDPKRLSPKDLKHIRKAMTTWFTKTRSDRARFKPGKTAPPAKWARPYRDQAIVELLLGTGLRVGALVDLDVCQFHFESQKLLSVVEKGGVVRDVAMTSLAANAVKAYIDNEREPDAQIWASNALFLAPANRAKSVNGRLAYRSVHQMIQKLGVEAGVPGLHPHWFRHQMAFELLERGGLPAVAAQLGHLNPSSTFAYTRMTTDDLLKLLD